MRKQAKDLTVKPGSHRVAASIVHERTGAGKGPDSVRSMKRQAAGPPGHTVMGADYTFDPPPKLGSGARFAALKAKLASRPGVRDPGALAAAIGRKKYGAAKMAKLSAKGRKG